jgi:ABC-type glycerol-3-phosphate transport system permease component
MENVPAAEAAFVAVSDRPLLRPSGHRRRATRWLHSGVSHAILWVLCLFALAPLLEALSTAIKTKREINTGNTLIPQFPTTANFAYVLGQTDFGTWLRNSLQIAIATTLCALAVGSLGGYAMSRWSSVAARSMATPC